MTGWGSYICTLHKLLSRLTSNSQKNTTACLHTIPACADPLEPSRVHGYTLSLHDHVYCGNIIMQSMQSKVWSSRAAVQSVVITCCSQKCGHHLSGGEREPKALVVCLHSKYWNVISALTKLFATWAYSIMAFDVIVQGHVREYKSDWLCKDVPVLCV